MKVKLLRKLRKNISVSKLKRGYTVLYLFKLENENNYTDTLSCALAFSHNYIKNHNLYKESKLKKLSNIKKIHILP